MRIRNLTAVRGTWSALVWTGLSCAGPMSWSVLSWSALVCPGLCWFGLRRSWFALPFPKTESLFPPNLKDESPFPLQVVNYERTRSLSVCSDRWSALVTKGESFFLPILKGKSLILLASINSNRLDNKMHASMPHERVRVGSHSWYEHLPSVRLTHRESSFLLSYDLSPRPTSPCTYDRTGLLSWPIPKSESLFLLIFKDESRFLLISNNVQVYVWNSTSTNICVSHSTNDHPIPDPITRTVLSQMRHIAHILHILGNSDSFNFLWICLEFPKILTQLVPQDGAAGGCIIVRG